jgi:NADH-quinone oxidoreductase E subunit
VSFRRLAPADQQPAGFAFSEENRKAVDQWIAKYPSGRQRSAVIAALWIGQEQEGWVTKPMIESVAQMLSMPYIRVLEVATFYTMFNLEPVGDYLVQVCTTTPCWLRGSDAVVETCKRKLGIDIGEVTPDGKFSMLEVECLGACVNAPVIQVNDDFYEDLDAASTEALLDALANDRPPPMGPAVKRQNAAPISGRSTLLSDPTQRKPAGTAPAGDPNAA